VQVALAAPRSRRLTKLSWMNKPAFAGMCLVFS